jgi:hypothetical protein
MRLFLSYRRNDTQSTARAMKEFLDGTPRVREVFLDFDTIPAGSPDFVFAINKALKKADASIVLIGPDWAGPKPDGSTRILEPEDHVRREVANALASGGKVFPVLVDGAAMPAEGGLPDDLKRLSRVNAVPLRNAQFKDDMIDLLNAISGKRGRGFDYWRRPPLTFVGAVARIVLGGAAAAALLIGATALLEALALQRDSCGTLNCLLAQHVGGLSEAEVNATPGSTLNQRYNGLSFLLQAGVVALGAAVPFIWRAVRR